MKKYALLALLVCLALCLPALAAADETAAKPMMDIVWVVDCTGSMPYALQMVKNNLDEFAAQLTDFDVQYGLVGFGDEVIYRPEPTVKIQWNGSEWTDKISDVQKSMVIGGKGGLPQYFGDDSAETPTCGLYMAATEYAWRENAVHAIVLVADNDYKTQGKSLVTGKAIPSMQECLDACGEKNISINLMNCGITTAYDNAVSQSEGIVGRYSDGWTTAVEQIAQWIHDTPIVITQPEDLYLHDDDIVYLTAVTVKGRDTWSSWYYVNKYGYRQGLIGYLPNNDGIARYRWEVDRYLDGNEYYCVFSNSNRPTGDTRSIETRHAILHVASKFDITGQPQDVTTEDGKTATFTVAATGDDLTYQWQKHVNGTWTNLSGETAATLSIPATLADNGSEYRCVIKDAISDKQPGGYTLTSDSAALTVVAAPAITGQPASVIVTEGQDAVFTVEATGEGLKYQWQVFRSEVWMDCIGEESPTLTLPSTALADDGLSYRCVVTSSHGTAVTSDAATLTVLAIPESPQTGDASRPMLWLTLLGVSLLGMTLLRRRRA